MTRITALAALPLAVLLAVGCEPQEQQQPDANSYADHLPDDRLLVAIPAGADRTVGDLADSYVTTVDVSTDVNGLISHVLDSIDHITSFDPTWSSEDGQYVWGPWDDGGLDPNHTALYVTHDETTGVYGWAIIKRDKDSTSDDDWVAIIAGEATEGATPETGEGFFIIDFDANASMDPTETASGRFISSYTITDTDVEASAAFEDFADETTDEPVSAVYVYGQDNAGGGFMDLGYRVDIHEDGSDEETVVLRTRWTPSGAGRGDTVVFGGDLTPLVFTGSECWGDDYNVTFEENNADLTRDGDEASCAFDQPEWNDDAPDEA